MSTRKIIATLVLGVALIAIAAQGAGGEACERLGCAWLATGTITRIDGSTFYLLGKDNLVYAIDASRAEMLSEFTNGSFSVRVGDTVRVYGNVTGAQKVAASRVRVMAHEEAPEAEPLRKEIRIIYEKPREEQPTEGAGPQPEVQPQPEERQCEWQGHGLITDVDYTGRMLKLRTSAGQFTINICDAQLVHGCKRIALGRLSLGDAVRVVGTLAGTNEVDAKQVRVLRTRTEAENSLPQMPIAIAGVIQQVDYPSLTFRMWTETTPLVVMADQDTLIQQQQCRMTFKDLRPGMRIKMNGYGSLGTGYAAKEILIISVSP